MTDHTRLSAALADRYSIESEAGRGGMATVYLAIDLRHERRVALKVLHPDLAAVIGAERFLQEIKLTAGLQHAHILPLHDSGVADGLLFYVMPFVEGETLGDVIKREKQLEITRAVELTRQIASALDYAHRQGIIHRDIKPENVLMHDGQAIVADFGIALAMSSPGGSRMTETGLSLGTPQYMSPEQAMGDREIDARSDIYSLGSMLYEMLAGDPPYTGSTAQAIVAKVITEKPTPITSHRDTVPPNVAAAIAKAIAKLPADRFHSAGDFADALANPAFTTAAATALLASEVAVPPSPVRRRAWPAVAAGFAVVAASLWLWPAPPSPVARYSLGFVSEQQMVPGPYVTFNLARDGSWLAYMGPDPTGGTGQIFVKLREQAAARPLVGTTGAWSPAASPDGQWIGYLVGTQVRKIPVIGGAPISLSDSAGNNNASSLAWGDDNVLTYTDSRFRIRRVDQAGGASTLAWTPPAARFAGVPEALPDGRGVLFLLCDANCRQTQEIWVLDLRSGEAHALVPGAVRAWYAAGRLIYARPDGGVFAQPFDLGSLTTSGAAIPILEGVQVYGFVPQMAPAADGTLLYVSGVGGNALISDRHEAVWLGRDGRAVAVDTTWHFDGIVNAGWALSPDGKRLAIKLNGEGGSHIHVKELDRGPTSRITFDSVGDVRPRWTPDGRRVSYVSRRGPGGVQALFSRRSDGTGQEEVSLALEMDIWEAVWSADGEWLVLRTGGLAGSAGGRDIYAMQLGVDSEPRPILVSESADERAIALSPDSRWLAYESDETGRNEVYVRPFPNVDDGKWQVSIAGGSSPLWAHSGREIFFLAPGNVIMVAPVSAGQGFVAGEREAVLTLGSEYLLSVNYRAWDISPDDQRFLMVRTRNLGLTESPTELILVQNWFEEVRAKTGR